MAAQGGSGTLKPPGDDNVAPVIPLRQRRTETTDAPTGTKLLPRERAAFDPELEPADVVLRRRRSPRAAIGRVREATARWHLRPRPGLIAVALAAAAAVGIVAAVVSGPRLFTTAGARPPSTVAQHPTTQVVQT